MPATIYTQRLALGAYSGSTAITTVYTVPSGKHVVLRCVDLLMAIAMSCYMAINDGSGDVYVEAFVSPGVNGIGKWRGRQVLQAGDTLRLWPTQPEGINYSITGYVFDS